VDGHALRWRCFTLRGSDCRPEAGGLELLIRMEIRYETPQEVFHFSFFHRWHLSSGFALDCLRGGADKVLFTEHPPRDRAATSPDGMSMPSNGRERVWCTLPPSGYSECRAKKGGPPPKETVQQVSSRMTWSMSDFDGMSPTCWILYDKASSPLSNVTYPRGGRERRKWRYAGRGFTVTYLPAFSYLPDEKTKLGLTVMGGESRLIRLQRKHSTKVVGSNTTSLPGLCKAADECDSYRVWWNVRFNISSGDGFTNPHQAQTSVFAYDGDNLAEKTNSSGHRRRTYAQGMISTSPWKCCAVPRPATTRPTARSVTSPQQLHRER